MSLVLGLGLEHSCPWPRECLSSERLSLALAFFCVRGIGLEPCVLDSTSGSQADECATIGSCKISRLLFADDLVLLSSTESGLQRAINSFADACNTAGMKISTAKTDVLHLSRNPNQCVLQVVGTKLKQVEKFKDFGVAFTSDGRQDEELQRRSQDFELGGPTRGVFRGDIVPWPPPLGCQDCKIT